MRQAFSLIEILIVVVIVGILAAIVVPQFAGAREQAETSALQADLAAVRAAIQNHRTRAVLAGTDLYPTLPELPDTVSGGIPTNPLNGSSTVQSVSSAQADARTVINPTTVGWNYYVDLASDPPVVIFYANSSDSTNVLDSTGAPMTANEL